MRGAVQRDFVTLCKSNLMQLKRLTYECNPRERQRRVFVNADLRDCRSAIADGDGESCRIGKAIRNAEGSSKHSWAMSSSLSAWL